MQELCVSVLMDILFRTEETKIVASDMLPKLNYYRKILSGWGFAMNLAGSKLTDNFAQKFRQLTGPSSGFLQGEGGGQNLKLHH